jgi:hypothetical protein
MSEMIGPLRRERYHGNRLQIKDSRISPMAKKIDLAALKTQLDLVTVLEARGVKFKRQGSSFVARCPFHTDRTPSFSVKARSQRWKCFGCGAAGDVFAFVGKQDGIGVVEAARKLCPQAFVSPSSAGGPVPGSSGVAAPPLASTAPPVTSPATDDVPATDRPGQNVLDRLVTHWHETLARTPRACAYLRKRGVWHPEILRAFRVGYASGRLPHVLPADGTIRHQLEEMGVLNDRGNEFFYRRLVVPILDAAGVLVNVYGRALAAECEVPHLYLPGPRRGVFNLAGVADAPEVILTEAILDALSLIVLGFTATTASYGAGGFTADHRAALLRAKTRRVYCVYDADPAGDTAAEQLALDLAGHGIEVLRVVLPCKDPNDFLVGGGTREGFQALLSAAAPIRTASDRATGTVGAEADDAAPARPAPADAFPLTVALGERTYRIPEPPTRGPRSLVAMLEVTRQDRRFVDTVNLYSDRARATFVGRLVVAFRGQVPRKLLEEDFFALIDEVEARVAPETPPAPAASPVTMSSADRDEALVFLGRTDLIAGVLEDLTRLGVVGEEDNKLLVYLVATSCLLPHPLSLSIISQSSAGKSLLINRVLDLFPPERVMRFTRMSPRALFYVDEPGRLKHKILFIEEAIGAKDADYGVRSMQSERRLANLVTMTDLKTGKLTTQETVVEGPLAYMTSSVEALDHETSTRSFEITIDESPKQTARIVDHLRHERTLAGIRERMAGEAITLRHRTAQRLLDPVQVVNEYADQLTFPSGSLRLRREAGKYFSLIEVLAFLHQHQRPRKTFSEGGQVFPYIEVVPADVELANRLVVGCLTRALSDLTGTALELLLAIKDYVSVQAEERGCDVQTVTFSRLDLRELTKSSNTHLHTTLSELAEHEYLEVVAGSFGKRYVYMLAPDHRLVVQAGLTVNEKILALGLTPADRLTVPAAFRSQRDLSWKTGTFPR